MKVIAVGLRVVSFNSQAFGNKASSRSALDLNDEVERVRDVGLDGAKANVKPPTTMASSASPFAMGPVNAVCKTFTAFP